MPVESMSVLLQDALVRRYAIGYFECWDQYSLEGSIEAAERLAAPAIIDFGFVVSREGADYLSRGKRAMSLEIERLIELYGRAGRALAS